MKQCFFLFAMCILACMGAAGQTAGGNLVNTQPQMLLMPEHPQHASQTPLAQDQDLRERATYVYAQGERPAWEFMPAPPFVPLADIARALREQHATAKKAAVTRND